nr:uncharacterized protein LOC109406605 isoform X2 [Aedes albopictus]
MNRECFDVLCSKMQGLAKQDTLMRASIPVNKRVAIAVYALGSSAEYRTVANLFGVGKSTVCELVEEFCSEVWRVMRHDYMDTFPLTKEKVEESVKGFESIGFPQCFGAIDGCHIEVSPHSDEAIDYHNYKGWYSTVLFASVDYRYRFQYISVGSPGRCNDSKIFESSKLKRELQDPCLKQYSKILNGVEVPLLLIGDSAFRLSDTVMKPYLFRAHSNELERTFNYFLSKARRVVENAFGHLKARFRRIGKGLDNRIDKVPLIVKCCCVLHNFLNVNNDKINQHWLQELRDYESTRKQAPEEVVTITDSNPTAQKIRDAIATYLATATHSETTHDEFVIESTDDFS